MRRPITHRPDTEYRCTRFAHDTVATRIESTFLPWSIIGATDKRHGLETAVLDTAPIVNDAP